VRVITTRRGDPWETYLVQASRLLESGPGPRDRDGRFSHAAGASSKRLCPTAFVSFLSNTNLSLNRGTVCVAVT
jgi:hypothetical protein